MCNKPPLNDKGGDSKTFPKHLSVKVLKLNVDVSLDRYFSDGACEVVFCYLIAHQDWWKIYKKKSVAAVVSPDSTKVTTTTKKQGKWS